MLDKDFFGLGKRIDLVIFGGKKQLKKAAKTDVDFIYRKDKLFFNENARILALVREGSL